MAKAAHSTQLQRLFQTHLQETESQVERLDRSLELLGSAARAKPCKGMAGLVEEGEDVIAEGKKKDDGPADLALIGAALRVSTMKSLLIPRRETSPYNSISPRSPSL